MWADGQGDDGADVIVPVDDVADDDPIADMARSDEQSQAAGKLFLEDVGPPRIGR